MTLVDVRRDGDIAVVELMRKEKRNALNNALRDAIEQTLNALAVDKQVKVVVLTGGPDMFCAGYDLKEMMASDLKSLFHRGHEYTNATYFFPKPLVSAVGGFALAGGFDLAISGDIIIATAGAKIGRPEIQWGVNPLMYKLRLRMGFAQALRFSLKGEVVDAEVARQLGIVDQVVDKDALLPTAIAEAHMMAKQSLPVLMATKRAAYKVATMSPVDGIEYEFGVTAELVAEGTPGALISSYAKNKGVT
jgi:enoyl-CoA hydratase